ncbi:MAG: hypothetical protein KJO31_07385, partial [Gammaproteobacteria bacterium]|nr:hypothetical protein [Gammaproteobacteria bacterium]
MSLEQYKTQVLLLHSQQSTLDVLSTGFNDRYAVHVATSGAEALNTLGDTPIHVIVSAQDLPGMSGLDAIREAKKRSPDTIGILLAGANRQDGLEALVGDQEVFQIVRGEISPPALVNLIESATRRMRLMTLSESANDQAANVDEPASEHIVMETLDNGSNVVTDISGQVPALNPRGAQPGADPGGRAVEVLVLTKDEEFLATIGDSSRGMHTVHHANTPAQAEDIVCNNRVGVLVTDAAMVGSNIEIITHRLRSVVPRLVAVVAGRRDDGELLMDLINRGHVYRFLLKPVSPGRARLAIEASVKHHMEADDGAFKQAKSAPPGRADNAKPAVRAVPRPAAAAAPRAKPAKAPRKPVSNAAKQAAAKAVARPAASRRKPSPAPPTGRKKRVDPTINAPAIDPTALEDSLNDAFSETSTLTETMTGLAAAVGESLKSTGKRSRSRDGRSKLLEDPVTDDSALSPKAIIAGVAVVAMAAAAWLYSGSDDSGLGGRQRADLPADSIPTVVETDVVPQPDPATRPGAQSTYQELLDEARTARDAGEIINPVGSNAIELYVLAREAAPNDPVVSAELEAVVEQVLGMAESAILDQRLGDADAALEKLELASPGNARLNFLRAQLDQLQLRSAADDARAAIRDGRFEDAAASIAAARQLSAGDFSGIDTVSAELDAARSEQQVDEVLALAAQRLEDGRLTSPANNNARYYYELALGNDSQNTAAKQGLVLIAGKLVLQAREAMDNG